jgi:uncharacterized protein (TIGR03435 family)
MDFKDMLGYAYDFHQTARMVFPGGLPDGRFDFLVTLPDHALEKFQAEITKQFGYTARRETREVDALALKVKNPAAPGLKISAGGINFHPTALPLFIDWPSCPVSNLANQLEVCLKTPVVDETGLNGNYDIKLDWNRRFDPAGNVEKFRQAVLDQLGLELVPTNMPIQMLVVGKVK